MPYPDFAKAMLDSFDRILHPRTGRAVVLLARRVADTVINLWDTGSLRIRDAHDILVSGHPATVLVGGRLAV